MVKTGKEYLEQLEAIGKAEAECWEGVRKAFEPRWKDLRAWYAAVKKAIDEAEARGENVNGRREALEREMEERSKPLATAESKAQDDCTESAQGARDSLEREARESGAYIPRLIIAAEGMAARAEHMRLNGVPGLGDVPIEDYAIVTVLSFAQLKRAVSIDRVCAEVIFVLPHLATKVALGKQTHSYRELTTQWRSAAKLKVRDAVLVGGIHKGREPGKSSMSGLPALFRVATMLAPAVLMVWGFLPAPPPRRDCWAPSEWVIGDGELFNDIDTLGVVAEAFIIQDFLKTHPSARAAELYIDDGREPSIWWNFLVANNPHVRTGPAAKRFLDAQRTQRRPDIALHGERLKEYYEVKPHSIKGRADGRSKLRDLAKLMDVVPFPYKPGTTYDPKGKDIRMAGTTGGVAFVLPITLYLRVTLHDPGLLVYDFCIEGEWELLLAILGVAALRLLLSELIQLIIAEVFEKIVPILIL